MADDVRLTDLEVIQRYSIAVRGETAGRDELLTALRADLAWLEDGRRTKPAATKATATKAKPAEPAESNAAEAAAKGDAAKPARPAKPAAKAAAKKAPAKAARR